MNARIDRGPRERFMSYMKGWRDGAGMKAVDPKFADHKSRLDIREEYARGYAAGQAAGRAASFAAEVRLGYTPTVLRIAGSEEPR